MFKKNNKNETRRLEKKGNQFNIQEVYRHIRTNIDFSNVKNSIKSISITSTQPGEGKTTTAVNLALTYAGTYSKVLLIDCDLRRPQIHKYFKISNKVGLSNYVLEYAVSQKYQTPEVYKLENEQFKGNLYVLNSGMRVPNPSEFIESQNFKDYIEHLKEDFDFIIIDCPPIGAVADAIPVGNLTSGTIFICSSQDTDKKDAAEAVETLKRANVNLIGTILTKADISRSKRYGYYYDYSGR